MRELLTAFLVRFASTYTTDDASLPERVRHAWLPVSATIGQSVRATTSDGRTVTGRAVGIDSFGSLAAVDRRRGVCASASARSSTFGRPTFALPRGAR